MLVIMKESIKKILKNQYAQQILAILFAIIMLDVFIIKNPFISALVLICGAFGAILVFCYIVANKID